MNRRNFLKTVGAALTLGPCIAREALAAKGRARLGGIPDGWYIVRWVGKDGSVPYPSAYVVMNAAEVAKGQWDPEAGWHHPVEVIESLQTQEVPLLTGVDFLSRGRKGHTTAYGPLPEKTACWVVENLSAVKTYFYAIGVHFGGLRSLAQVGGGGHIRTILFGPAKGPTEVS